MAHAPKADAASELHHQLTPPDEYFHHQTVGFFGEVNNSDLNWRERCWIPIQSKDGRTVICVGLGNFPNRNVQDGFVIVSHAGKQHNMRMSRELGRNFHELSVGPLTIEIVEPLKTLRVCLEPNISGLACDFLWTGKFRPHVQAHLLQRWKGRTLMDVDRYFQVGTVTGELIVDGERLELDPAGWAGTRDKSWGVRQTADLVAAPLRPREPDMYFLFAAQFEHYGLFCCVRDPWAELGGVHGEDLVSATGGFMYPFDDDRPERRIRGIDYDFRVAPGSPRGVFEAGELVLTFADGEQQSLTVTAQEGGFHLRPGYGYDGWQQGEWKGAYHEGATVIDLSDPEALIKAGHVTKAARYQIGDDVGYGVFEFFPRLDA
jgi:hypothetical protein